MARKCMFVGVEEEDDETLKVSKVKKTKTILLKLPTEIYLTKVLRKPFDSSLNGDAFWTYRRRYQKFRLGDAHGAQGEIDDVLEENERIYSQPSNTVATLPTAIFSLEETCNENDYWEEDTGSMEMQKRMQDISKFRAGYRQFRRGAAQGSHREISDLTQHLTKEHLRLLPVSQLQTLHLRMGELKSAKERNVQLGFRKSILHVHFGAGKLGLGLICSALVRSELPFVIVDSPFVFWDPLLESKESIVEIIVNGLHLTSLQVVRTKEELMKALKMIKSKHEDRDKGGWLNCLVVSDDKEMLRELMQESTTFSSSVGPGIVFISDVLKAMKSSYGCNGESLPTFYGCENDHKAVEKLSEELKGVVDVVTCMVDRICTVRKFVEPNKIEVFTEEDLGNIVVLTPLKLPTYRPSFAGENVNIPTTSAEAQYLSNRKICIVNGMHTTLAFMTLCLKNTTDEVESHPLLTSATLPEDKKADVWAWAVGRVLMLVWQHDIDVIKHTHGIKEDLEVVEMLLAFARRALKRFTCIDDTTGRVLSGGVANRWMTRLKPVDEFLSNTEIGELPLGKICLKTAEITEHDLRTAVTKLTKESYRFTKLSDTILKEQ